MTPGGMPARVASLIILCDAVGTCASPAREMRCHTVQVGLMVLAARQTEEERKASEEVQRKQAVHVRHSTQGQMRNLL